VHSAKISEPEEAATHSRGIRIEGTGVRGDAELRRRGTPL